MNFVTAESPPGALFNKPLFLGIAWGSLFYIGFLWWGILQAIFTFYFANRIIKRDWDHPRMGKLGWALAIGYNVVVFTALKAFNRNLAPVQPSAYLIFALVVLSTALFLWQDIKKNKDRQPWQFEQSRVMDFLSFGSLILFVFLGTFFAGGQVLDPASTSHINPTSLKIVNIWTFAYSAVFLFYRFRRGKEITV